MLCFSCALFFWVQEWKRSGQIPPFGDWKNANELPITQYFDCARQAGLIRYSNSSGECDCPAVDYHNRHRSSYGEKHHLQQRNSNNNYNHTQRKTRLREKRGPTAQLKDTNLQQHDRLRGRDRDVTGPPRHQKKHSIHNNAVPPPAAAAAARIPARAPKPVDEDLYKIPPHLLRSSKRKKVPGFLACFVPSACAS
ncbi:hypothetical protein LINPERHAP1_LOCUS9750 [Linum perenne]